jgi:serine/threonine protein kinase/tetratricopeptide (TPR) repeat protein
MTEEALFHAALAVPPAERAAWLAEHCPDSELRRRVENLIAAHDRPAGPLDSPATGAYEPSAADVPGAPGMQVGQYKLLQLIGEGGMGAVWMAEQEQPVRRRVAVKVIKPGMDSRQVIARFEAERQALALMDHPNIAKVLDAGTTDLGHPFFVMELVDGVPITRYCDASHLTPRERLVLFVPVCQAVQHAHQKGIIHRDIKPSNVLIAMFDGRPVPKVIDFGVAKATNQKLTERTMFTEFGQIVGTLEYMAPEQAEPNNIDIDTRADVYSLGVILYELLAGSPPFTATQLRAAAFTEMLRMIREIEPPKPSTKLSSSENLPTIAANRRLDPRRLTKLVHGDLDWIAMKCLEKDRGRRYQTANGLALEIQRFLADEPVLAGPPSAVYRLRKFVRRNKGPVLAASVVVLTLVGGIVGTTIGLLRAQAAQRAEAEQRRLAEAAADAEKAATKAAEKRLTQIERGSQVLYSIFTDLDINDVKMGNEPLEAVLALRLIRAAGDLEGEAIGNPLVVAVLQNRLGTTLLNLDHPRDAMRLFLKAVDTAKNGLGTDHPATLDAMGNLAQSYLAAGRLNDALPLYEKTLGLMRAKLGPNHPDTVAAMSNLGHGYQTAGKLDLALPLLEEALKLFKTVLGPDERRTLVCMNNLAAAYLAAGKSDLAAARYEETLKLMRAKLGPDHALTLRCMNNLAAVHLDAGKSDLAMPLLEDLLKSYMSKLGADNASTLTVRHNLAGAYRSAGKLDLALSLEEETLKLRRAKLGPEHPDTLSSVNDLAADYRLAGKLDLALPLEEEVFKVTRAKLGPEHPLTLIALQNLAIGYEMVGKTERALSLYEESLKLHKAKFGPDHPRTLAARSVLAGGYRSAGKFDLALPLYEETLKLMRAKNGPDHPDTLATLANLASCCEAAGKLDMALPLLEETVRLMKAKFGPSHPNTLTVLNNLASAYQSAGRRDRALPIYEESLKLAQAKLGPAHPIATSLMNNLALAHRDAGEIDVAVPLLEQTLKLRQARMGADNPLTLDTMGFLVQAYLAAKAPEKALPLVREFLQRRKKLFGDGSAFATTEAFIATGLLKAGEAAAAEPLLRECLSIRERVEPDAWTVFSARSMLGDALSRQRRFAEAEPLLVQGYEGMKKRYVKPGTSAPGGHTAPAARSPGPPPLTPIRLVDAFNRLIRLYSNWGKPAEAARWLEALWEFAECGEPP